MLSRAWDGVSALWVFQCARCLYFAVKGYALMFVALGVMSNMILSLYDSRFVSSVNTVS